MGSGSSPDPNIYYRTRKNPWACPGDFLSGLWYFSETGRAEANTVAAEVVEMFSAVWLMLGTLLYSLQLNTGSFPRPLSEAEEQSYLRLAQTGDLEARNILIERNLRLVAHIMKKY